MEGYVSKLWDFNRISVTQNNLKELKEVDLVLTVEEYTLLHCPRIQANKGYSRAANIPTFLKKIMSITGMSEQWRAVGYGPLLVLRQYRSRQFISTMLGIKRLESNPQMKRFAANPMTILEYDWWWGKRVNNNITVSSQENTRPIEEHLQVVPSKLETIKQDFEKRSSELGKKIEQLKEEKMHLGLDVDVQKLEAEKMRKGKNKAEKDLDSLKIDYKKLPLSIRTIGLGKTSK
ncbi:hypothetical protein Goshw_029943 [Gossypium schwendimanii]|uniref:Aminotransferase-like plant mobile domain-containing protein n=1 Tax=Gossypium schwendimanii TaxID=34291 RepID=A0A7J9N946_GOSSC|nr:hypothetical protein [Gossypium schwendimanii]